MLNYDNLNKLDMNNLASTDQELKDISLEYLEEIDNTINVIPGDI